MPLTDHGQCQLAMPPQAHALVRSPQLVLWNRNAPMRELCHILSCAGSSTYVYNGLGMRTVCDQAVCPWPRGQSWPSTQAERPPGAAEVLSGFMCGVLVRV